MVTSIESAGDMGVHFIISAWLLRLRKVSFCLEDEKPVFILQHRLPGNAPKCWNSSGSNTRTIVRSSSISFNTPMTLEEPMKSMRCKQGGL